MKKILLTLTVAALSVATMYGQARVAFNNESTFAPADAVTVAVLHGAQGGNTGDGIGSDFYSVQLRWVAGAVAGGQAGFDAAAPTSSAVFSGAAVFLAPTGPTATFSGFFDGGAVSLGGAAPAGTYTMQVLAWYNVGFATFDAAVAAGTANTGRSAIFTMAATASPTPINTTPVTGFQVGIIPEPSTFALAGLGIASLLIFRRKK